MSSFIQSVPGTTKLHRPCDPADPCSGQKSWCNPMELDRHGLFIPAYGSARLQGSLVHHEYSSCSFGILHYPLSANTELYYYWRPPDGAQPCGMTLLFLLFQFLAGNIIPVLALWVLSSCRLFSVAKLWVHLQSEKLLLYHPSCGLTFCLNIIYVVQDKSSCSFLFGQQLEPWHPWEIVLLVTVYHHPPPAKPPDKSTYISADKRVRIQWSILIVDCSCNYSWLMHSATLFKFKVRKVLVLHIGARGTSADVFSIGYYLILHNQKVQIELSIMVAFSQAPNLQNMQLGAQKGQCSSRIILMSECAINYGPLFKSWFQPLPTGHGFLSEHGCEQFEWEIAWLIDLDYISVDNKPRLPVQWDPSLCRSLELIQKWMMSFPFVELQPGIFLLVPIVQRVASDDCHRIMMLGKYSSCMESLSESFPWYIAWSCAGSDSDGSGTLTSLRKYLGSWEELLTPTKDALHLQQANNTCHFLPPAGPPATCDTWVLLMAHGLLNALICGVLLVQSYSRLVLQVITCCPMKHSFRNLVIPRAVDTMLNKYTTCYAWRLSNVTFLQASTDSCFIRYSGLRGCELVYWKIAWPLNLVYSTCGNMSRKLFHLIKVRCEGYLQKGNAALPPFSSRTVRVCLLIYWSRFYHTENSGCNYLTSGTKGTVPIQFLASVATWTFRGLEFCHRKLPWDPGIWALLCFFGSFTRAEAKGRRSAAAPAYCHCLDHAYYVDKVRADQDYYLDVSRDQVHIGNDYYLGVFLEQVDAVPYLNLIKVRLDYGTHRDLGEVMKHQVPWDPGGSTWHRLEVKPEFKEGGMLATNPTLAWAGPKAVGLGLHRSLRRKQLHIRSECLRTRRLGKGRLRPPQLLSASSSSAPLPVMARSR